MVSDIDGTWNEYGAEESLAEEGFPHAVVKLEVDFLMVVSSNLNERRSIANLYRALWIWLTERKLFPGVSANMRGGTSVDGIGGIERVGGMAFGDHDDDRCDPGGNVTWWDDYLENSAFVIIETIMVGLGTTCNGKKTGGFEVQSPQWLLLGEKWQVARLQKVDQFFYIPLNKSDQLKILIPFFHALVKTKMAWGIFVFSFT